MINKNDIHNYDDIINIKYEKSKNHTHMPIGDRAAQFAPFAALNGYDDSINEAGRLIDEKINLNEYEKQELNRKLNFILNNNQNSEVEITYFIPDSKKNGGQYINYNGIIRIYDEFNKELVFIDKTRIKIDDIIEIKVNK